MTDEGTPDEYEPKPHERVWYTHALTGDRGYAVRRLGKDLVRRDRPGIDDVSDPSNWKRLVDDVPRFSAIQIAQVCFEADKKLCWALGQPDLAKREWLDLKEPARIKWLNEGPRTAQRAGLYAVIRDYLKSL